MRVFFKIFSLTAAHINDPKKPATFSNGLYQVMFNVEFLIS